MVHLTTPYHIGKSSDLEPEIKNHLNRALFYILILTSLVRQTAILCLLLYNPQFLCVCSFVLLYNEQGDSLASIYRA